ncbi:MAG TPA: dTDP-4-dehydrorhamnose 3,5-epimerase [Terriglobales bacterium]|nr:dTDP-4-dehydrorhamnose 3,5-epimerase [Terriglobales bacterium]
MKFLETSIPGAFVVEPEPLGDSRGFFARLWCAREFAELGLDTATAQISISYNREVGTLRGMHFQASPREETKLVRCVAGAIFDVVVDLRPDSAAYRRCFGIELWAPSHRALYVPKGVAHGYQVLAPDTEVLYQISEFYDPQSARGVRWNDPAFQIAWPLPEPILSERDASYADFPL